MQRAGGRRKEIKVGHLNLREAESSSERKRRSARQAGSKLTMDRGDDGRDRRKSNLKGMRGRDKLEERKGTDWHRDNSQMSGHKRGSHAKECRGGRHRETYLWRDINNLCLIKQ